MAVVTTHMKVESGFLRCFLSLRLPPQNIDLRLTRPRRACLVAVATTALTRSSAGGPNTARPQRDILTAVGIVAAAATDWPWPQSWFKKRKKKKKSQQLLRPCVRAWVAPSSEHLEQRWVNRWSQWQQNKAALWDKWCPTPSPLSLFPGVRVCYFCTSLLLFPLGLLSTATLHIYAFGDIQ